MQRCSTEYTSDQGRRKARVNTSLVGDLHARESSGSWCKQGAFKVIWLRRTKAGALPSVLIRLEKEGAALGHFNVADLVLLKAALAAAGEIKVPVLVGASEGERAFFRTRQLAVLLKNLRQESGLPIFLNADHTHSLAQAIEAVKAGFDAVIADFSALPFAENVSRIKEAVEAMKVINPSVLVEGEIGNIGSGSEIHDTVPSESRMSSLLPRKPGNSLPLPESMSSLRRWATGTAC
jgi:Fructose-bisphosphate aldolase class-II